MSTRSRLRRLLRARRERVEPGQQPIVIASLVSPLRLDIVLRRRFFDFLERESGLNEKELIARARGEAYFQWFRTVVYPRDFATGGGRSRQSLERAFGERVLNARRLLASFEARGMDPERPPTLRTGSSIEPTATGKALRQRVFAGDGCHRLALLWRAGLDVLEPGSYLLARAPRLAPLDITARLLGPLGTTSAEYFGYLSLSYGAGARAATEEQLIEIVSKRLPDRLDEVRSVIASDAPLLADGGIEVR